jgi:N-acetylglucosamine kinase-like BadF-type ATPase
MATEEIYNIIGIDGGATSTRGVLFTDNGETLSTIMQKGTNLALYMEDAAKRIAEIICKLCEKAKINISDVDAVGLGLAGASDEDGRDLVFRELDGLNLSRRSIIMNDAEAAYEVGCPGETGLLVTVGTGVICIGRNAEGKIFRVAGKGHDNGDCGSGFWIGRQAIMHLALNESSITGDAELEQLMKLVLSQMESDSFSGAIQNTMDSVDSVPIIASMAEGIISLAENGHEIALGIIQEGTSIVSEYILQIAHEMELVDKPIILAGNGSVLRNEFYRRSLNDALQFNFHDIKWTFSMISSAYGAGMLAAKLHEVDISIPEIINGNVLSATAG